MNRHFATLPQHFPFPRPQGVKLGHKIARTFCLGLPWQQDKPRIGANPPYPSAGRPSHGGKWEGRSLLFLLVETLADTITVED